MDKGKTECPCRLMAGHKNKQIINKINQTKAKTIYETQMLTKCDKTRNTLKKSKT